MSSITLRNVSYRYAHGGVSDVSFAIPEGQVACLLGPSGSGKTTLLKLIGGFLDPQQGEILLGDEKVAGAGSKSTPPQGRHIGLVFQQHALFPHLTVEKNILYGCTEKDKSKREDIVSKLLNDFKISQHKKRYPHQISGGEQQRVALARAIASAPRLLLMDEPFSSLDTALRHEVRQECLNIIRARGLTTIIVTHDEAEAEVMGDMTVRL